jgi:hypothetical protein
VPGFLGNLHNLYAGADEESQEWEQFLLALEAKFPNNFTSADIVAGLDTDQDLLDALPTALAEKRNNGADFGKCLGKALSQREARRFGQEQIRLEGAGDRRRALMWRVAKDVIVEAQPAIGRDV